MEQENLTPDQVPLVFTESPGLESALNASDSVICRVSRAKAMRFTVTLLVLLPVLVVALVLSIYVGFCCLWVVFGGLTLLILIALPFAIYQFFDTRPKLVICREGLFEHTTFKQEFIAWERIAATDYKVKHAFPLPADRMLILQVLDESGHAHPREVEIGDLDTSADEILRMVQQAVHKVRGQ